MPKTYIDKILEEDLEDLLMWAKCPIDLPDESKSLHLALPDLYNLMLLAYERRGRELLTYQPPAWLVSACWEPD